MYRWIWPNLSVSEETCATLSVRGDRSSRARRVAWIHSYYNRAFEFISGQVFVARFLRHVSSSCTTLATPRSADHTDDMTSVTRKLDSVWLALFVLSVGLAGCAKPAAKAPERPVDARHATLIIFGFACFLVSLISLTAHNK